MLLQADAELPDVLQAAPAAKAEGKPKPKRTKETKEKQRTSDASLSSKRPKVEGDEEGEEHKKCKRCKMVRPLSEFFQGQAGCKPCSKDVRNLENHARSSGEVGWFKALSEGEMDALLQAYQKERQRASKERTKIKFNMTTYKEKTVHSVGTRREGRRRMMFEEQYYAWARTAEGGSLSRQQAEKEWKDMKLDPNVPREGDEEADDFKMGIKICTDLIDYDDHSKLRELEQQARINNKLSQEQLEQKTNILVTAAAPASGSQAVNQEAVQAALAGTAIAAEGMVLPQIAKLKKRNAQRRVEDSDAEAVEEGEEGAEEEAGKDSSSAPRRFDVQSQIAKNKRQCDAFLTKKGAAMDTLKKSMRECIDNARSAGAATMETPPSWLVELKICSNRLTALELIRSCDQAAYKSYLTNLKAEAPTSDARSVASSGQDRSRA